MEPTQPSRLEKKANITQGGGDPVRHKRWGTKKGTGFRLSPFAPTLRSINCGRLVALAAATIAATATAVAAAAAAGELTARAAGFHGARFVDGQVAAVVVLAVQSVDGALAFFAAAHGNKAEATGAVRLAVHDQAGVGDGAVLGEEFAKVLLGGLEGKISHVQFHVLV